MDLFGSFLFWKGTEAVNAGLDIAQGLANRKLIQEIFRRDEERLSPRENALAEAYLSEIEAGRMPDKDAVDRIFDWPKLTLTQVRQKLRKRGWSEDRIDRSMYIIFGSASSADTGCQPEDRPAPSAAETYRKKEAPSRPVGPPHKKKSPLSPVEKTDGKMEASEPVGAYTGKWDAAHETVESRGVSSKTDRAATNPPATASSAHGRTQSRETGQKAAAYDAARKYVNDRLQYGATREEISTALEASGWTESQIDEIWRTR